MAEKEFCDFVINQDGMYQVPSFVGFVEEQTLQTFEQLVKQHKQGLISVPCLKKNPSWVEEFERLRTMLQNLPSQKSTSSIFAIVGGGCTQVNQQYNHLGAYVCSPVGFASRLNNGRRDVHNAVVSSDEWKWEDAKLFKDQAPHFVEIMQGLLRHADKHKDPNSRIHYDIRVANFNNWQKQYDHLTQGTWKKQEAKHEDRIARKMEGLGVAVYLNASNCYLSSNNQTTESLAGAKIYESLAAAKRSLKSMNMLNQSLSFVEVDVRVNKILEHTGNVVPDLREIGALREKEELLKEVISHQHPVSESTLANAPKKKNKM